MSVSTSNYNTTCPDCHGSGDKTLTLTPSSRSSQSSESSQLSQSSFIEDCDTCFGTGDLYIASQVICNCHPCLDRSVYEYLKEHTPIYQSGDHYVNIDETDIEETPTSVPRYGLCHTS